MASISTDSQGTVNGDADAPEPAEAAPTVDGRGEDGVAAGASRGGARNG